MFFKQQTLKPRKKMITRSNRGGVKTRFCQVSSVPDSYHSSKKKNGKCQSPLNIYRKESGIVEEGKWPDSQMGATLYQIDKFHMDSQGG